MDIKKGEDPAYPAWNTEGYSGVSRREYFAAMAMQGLLAADHDATMHQNDCAHIAVAHADALLEELAK